MTESFKKRPVWGKWQTLGAVFLIAGVFASTVIGASAGTTAPREESIPLSAAQLVNASNVSYLLTDEGELYSQGLNNYGQLGVNSLINETDWKRVKFTAEDPQPVITKIDSKGEHVLALDESGGLWTWGAASSYALGTSNGLHKVTPSKMTISYSFSTVEAGDDFFIALDSQGIVYSWGSNDHGQLGRKSSESSDPTMVFFGTRISSIAAGKDFALAVDNSGGLWAWGNNAKGQFGNGTTEGSTTPIKIADDGWKTVYASRYADTVIAINTANEVFSWGDGAHALLGNGRDWRQEQIDENERIADAIQAIEDADEAEKVRLTNEMLAPRLEEARADWNSKREKWLSENPEPKASDFPELTPTPTPDPVTENEPEVDPFEEAHAEWVEARDEWLDSNPEPTRLEDLPAAIRNEARAEVEDTFEATDTDHLVPEEIEEPKISDDSLTPVKVETTARFTKIAIGSQAAFALDLEGSLWAWGNDENGQTGLGLNEKTHTHRPVKISGRSYNSLWAGPEWAMASGSNAGLFTWGMNDSNNRLISSNETLLSPTSAAGEAYAHVAGSSNLGAAIRSDGSTVTWGANAAGQAGQNADDVIVGFNLIEGNFTKISFSATSSASLSGANGQLYFWGANPYGFSGVDSKEILKPARQVISSFIDVAAGRLSSHVVDVNGFVWTWGLNWHPELSGPAVALRAPTKVTINEPVTKIAATQTDVLVITETNKIITWGARVTGLGPKTIPNETTFSAVEELLGAKNFFLLRDDEGRVLQLSTHFPTAYLDGMEDEVLYQIQLPGDAVAIGAGGDTAIAIVDGKAFGWGSNNANQLVSESDEKLYTELVELPSPYSGVWEKIATSDTHTLAASSSKLIYGWGSSKYIKGLGSTKLTKPIHFVLTEAGN